MGTMNATPAAASPAAAAAASAHVPCAHCGAVNRVPVARLAEEPVCGRCGQTLLPGHPIELDDRRLPAFLQACTLPVIVDVWAPWYGPCRSKAPHFERAAAALQGQAVLVKVNSDENPVFAGRHAIRSIPTVLKLQGGRELDRLTGARPVEALVAWARA